MSRSGGSDDAPHLPAPGYDAMFGRNDINDRLGEITCPSIVLHGEHNPANGPEVSQELADRLGACDGLTIVPGSGTRVYSSNARSCEKNWMSFLALA